VISWIVLGFSSAKSEPRNDTIHPTIVRGLPSQVTSRAQLIACYFIDAYMKKQVLIHGLIYGLCGGVLIVVLRLVEYRFLVVEHSVEIYGGLIALLFAALGGWLGIKLTRKKEVIVLKEVLVSADAPFALNQQRVRELSITPRELEILELIANGMSNREIAEKLFVSESTVKTHSSRLFDKLSAKRRTQAVQIGKELRLIP
jgi:DNA-binding CsgD family transcriptional regulator